MTPGDHGDHVARRQFTAGYQLSLVGEDVDVAAAGPNEDHLTCADDVTLDGPVGMGLHPAARRVDDEPDLLHPLVRRNERGLTRSVGGPDHIGQAFPIVSYLLDQPLITVFFGHQVSAPIDSRTAATIRAISLSPSSLPEGRLRPDSATRSATG